MSDELWILFYKAIGAAFSALLMYAVPVTIGWLKTHVSTLKYGAFMVRVLGRIEPIVIGLAEDVSKKTKEAFKDGKLSEEEKKEILGGLGPMAFDLFAAQNPDLIAEATKFYKDADSFRSDMLNRAKVFYEKWRRPF